LAIKDYPELLHLEIRANRFKTIPTEFVCPKLQKLYMGGNLIKEVKLHGFQQLQVLHLRGNRIVSLAGLMNLPLLSYLNLR
jgi:Leucine-rich repeat (LRR) protein